MKRFVDGVDRTQALLLPNRLEDYVRQDNPIRLIDAFMDALDLGSSGFETASRAAGGRTAYHPPALLKIYIYGYLNRARSSRRLEREAQRNLDTIWLTGRLAPAFKTIAAFLKDNGAAIAEVCSPRGPSSILMLFTSAEDTLLRAEQTLRNAACFQLTPTPRLAGITGVLSPSRRAG